MDIYNKYINLPINTEVFTTIPNTYIKGENSEDTKKIVVLLILLLNRTFKGITTFSIKNMMELINIKSNNTQAIKKIKDVLNYFANEKLVKYYEDVFITKEVKDIRIININTIIYAKILDEAILSNEDYTLIYDEEVKRILDYSIDNKINQFDLLSTYIYILSYINNNEQDENYMTCFPKFETISEDINISEKTVMKYIDILNCLQLLVFDYAGYKELSKGKIKNGVMFYARYKDVDKLLTRLKLERDRKGYIQVNKRSKDKSNLKRSLKQKINLISKKEKEGTINEIDTYNKELLIKKYNELDEITS